MRHGDHVITPTISEVVHRAVAVCDPDGADEALVDFLAHYEDRDEPVTALGEQRTREFFETAGRLEGQAPDAGLWVAAAVATYLAFRRDEVRDNGLDLLRLSVRAEYGDDVPPGIESWLADVGAGP